MLFFYILFTQKKHRNTEYKPKNKEKGRKR